MPLKVGRNGLGISHLMFANDLILFGEATTNQIEVVMECLNVFLNALG